MKKFLKMVLAVICGMLVVGILSVMILSGFISALSSGSSNSVVLPKSGVLAIDMSTLTIGEQSKEVSPMAAIQGTGETETIGLRQAVKAVEAAADDPAIKYIYLKTDGNSTGVAVLEEFRKSLDAFRKSGKPVIAYMESPSTGGYYLASVADKIYMTSAEGASSMFTGVGGQLIFLKDLLDKLGVNVQLIRHGKYKSAGEMYIRSSASEENLEQNMVMINSIWKGLAGEIAKSRGISTEELNADLDELKLVEGKDFVEQNLVDSLLTREELCKRLATLAVEDDFKNVKMVSLADYASVKVQQNIKAKKKIAVIFANGEIVDGKAKQDVAGDRFASIISKVRADSTVKAVVLRVSSPGGSVLASEKMRDEIELLRKEKPVIASYGEYAASGGYWISSSCDKIFSDAATLTGSIGCFSMIPDLSGTAKNLAHINVTTIGSNKHSDMYSLMRPLDKDELDYMQKGVENIYDKFVNIVAAGRDLEPSYVDEIGQGRVWTGSDALGIGLVDEIGTLEDAISFAAVSAGDSDLSAWNIAEYPKPLSMMDTIMESIGQGMEGDEAKIFKGTALENTARILLTWSKDAAKGQAGKAIARIPYDITIR